MKITDAEWQIMNILWARYPATARGISERLPEDINWAYTTIKTLLSRLVGKKAVRETKNGNTSIYEPVITKQTAQRNALKILVNQAFDGAFGPLMHFLLEDQKLSTKQKKELLDILQSAKNRKRKGIRNDRDTKHNS